MFENILSASSTWSQWLIFAVYMAVILSVAFFTRKKSKSVEGFMFANKGVGAWFTAFAYGATYFSAVVFVGYAGKFGWNFGLSAVWVGIGNMLIGTLLAWLVLAKRTKKMTTVLNARTMPEFFEKRYDSKHIKLVASLVIFIFLLPYSASVYQGMGYIFEAVLHIDAIWCILILAGLTAVYLFLGGYFATTITDFIQGIIMLVGVTAAVFMFLANDKMNWGEGLTALFNDANLTLLANPETPAGKTFLDNQLFNVIILVCLTSFGIWGLPQSVHKFYAVKDDNAIKKGMIISTLFSAVVGVGAYFMGSMVTRFVDTMPAEGADRLIPQMIVENLPSAMLGLIIVLLFSASMSTLASLSLSSASTVTVDFMKGYVKKNMPDTNMQILLRVLCLIFVALSAVLAILEIDAIVSMMSLSWGAIAGCFMGPYIYGLYSKKANKAGAYASIIASILVTILLIIWLGYFQLDGQDPTFGEAIKAGISRSPFIGVVSMVLSMIVTPLFSLIFHKECKVSDKKINELFSKEIKDNSSKDAVKEESSEEKEEESAVENTDKIESTEDAQNEESSIETKEEIVEEKAE